MLIVGMRLIGGLRTVGAVAIGMSMSASRASPPSMPLAP